MVMSNSVEGHVWSGGAGIGDARRVTLTDGYDPAGIGNEECSIPAEFDVRTPAVDDDDAVCWSPIGEGACSNSHRDHWIGRHAPSWWKGYDVRRRVWTPL